MNRHFTVINPSALLYAGVLVCLLSSYSSGQDYPISLSPVTAGSQVTEAPPVQKNPLALEQPVDPRTYRLGPGDGLEMLVFGTVEIRIPINVGPDGTIVVPSVGLFKVDTLTLAGADSLLKANAGSMYPHSQIDLRLLSLRTMMVSVTGYISTPGIYPVLALTRLSSLIATAGGIIETVPGTNTPVAPTEELPTDKTRDKYNGASALPMGRKWFMDDSDPQRITPSFVLDSDVKATPSYRRIQITGREGKPRVYDYEKFLNSGDNSQNPVLTDGDVVYIPSTDLRLSSLFVTGAVNLPDNYEFVPGDRLRDLIEVAGGFAVGAQNDRITVNRRVVTGDSSYYESREVSLSDGDRGIELQPQDQVFVRGEYDYRGMSQVHLLGEIKHPGVYPINEEETTLFNVVKQAGFFTDRADLTHARVIRWSAAERYDPEYYGLKQFEWGNMSQFEISYVKTKNRFDPPVVSVDFVKLFRDHDLSKDVLLHNGDEIEIPYKTQTVNVIGFVNHPGLITYKQGESYEYYINLAGGFSFNAKRSMIRILKGATGKWVLATKHTVIEVGDTIFIPEKDDLDLWSLFKDTLLVVSQVTTIILVVRNLGL